MSYFEFHGAVLDKEPFPLPQPGLFADLDLGTGNVALSDEFHRLPQDKKLAILSGWQRDIERERRVAIVNLFHALTDPLGGVGLPQKIACFKRDCARMGIEFASDIVILLQQV